MIVSTIREPMSEAVNTSLYPGANMVWRPSPGGPAGSEAEAVFQVQAKEAQDALQREFEAKWNAVRFTPGAPDRQKLFDALHAEYVGKAEHLKFQISQELTKIRMIAKARGADTAMAAIAGENAVPERVKGPTQAQIYARLRDEGRDTADALRYYRSRPDLTAREMADRDFLAGGGHTFWHTDATDAARLKELQSRPDVVEYWDEASGAYDNKGDWKQGVWRRATDAQTQEYKKLQQQQSDTEAMIKAIRDSITGAAPNIREGGTFADKIAASVKPQGTGQKYTIGDKLNVKGRVLTVVGFDADGEPMVE